MKFVSTLDLPDNATMAHVAAHVGIFPSVTQARKNGFDRPIVLGEHYLTKKRIPVTIVDRPLSPSERKSVPDHKNRPDLEPGFWNDHPAQTNLARAIEFPLNDPLWKERVISAYIKDSMERKRG